LQLNLKIGKLVGKMKIHQKFRIEGYFDNFIEKYKDYPITIYTDHPVQPQDIDYNRINLFMIHEPNEIFNIHNWVIQNHHLFHGVISWSKDLVKSIPNGIEFPCSWRMNGDSVWEFLGPKKFEITFLCGTKKITEGHKLRHKVLELKGNINPPHRFYETLEDWDTSTNTRPGYSEYSRDLSHIPDAAKFEPNIYGKKDLYINSMFNIGIENVKHDNWINDKLYSCFSSLVVPIYWGCENLEENGYDERGVIRFNSKEELKHILDNLTEQDYHNRLEYLKHNYEVNKKDTLENNLSYFLDELIKINNL